MSRSSTIFFYIKNKRGFRKVFHVFSVTHLYTIKWMTFKCIVLWAEFVQLLWLKCRPFLITPESSPAFFQCLTALPCSPGVRQTLICFLSLWISFANFKYIKSASVFLIQGFPHSDKLPFSEVFMVTLVAQNAKTALCFPPAGFSKCNVCASRGDTSGLVLNWKTRKVKDFQIEVKIYWTLQIEVKIYWIYRGIFKTKTETKQSIITTPYELSG